MAYSNGFKSRYRYGRFGSRSSFNRFRSSRFPSRSRGIYSGRSGFSYSRRGSRYSSRLSSRPYGRSTSFRSRRGGVGCSVAKGTTAEQVLIRTVSSQDLSVVKPDVVGLNGLRVRLLCLTAPEIPSEKVNKFNGKARWIGLTCASTYELSGPGPFLHRRVLFKSTQSWPRTRRIKSGEGDGSGGVSEGDFVCENATDLTNGSVVRCLSRLFAQGTVRGVVQGPVAGLGVTVLKDEKLELRGQDVGVRKERKWWNSFRKEAVMEYQMEADNSFSFALTNSPKSQHIYLLDVFSYGLEGLDSPLPDLTTPPTAVPSGGSADALQGRGSKRSRSDDSVMSGTSGSSFGTSGLRESLPNPMNERLDDARVSITTLAKLYFSCA